MTDPPTLGPGDSVTLDGVDMKVAALVDHGVVLTTAGGGCHLWHIPELMRATSLNGQIRHRLHRTRPISESQDPTIQEALTLEAHIIEATTGRSVNGEHLRSGYDPDTTSQAERDQRKVAELKTLGIGVSLRT